jgi:3-keto-L-gulonate-6-phosphate decarboxylase
MKLQISFDALSIEENLEIAYKVAPFAFILEIGTLPILKHGTKIVEIFRKAFPDHLLFADTKIVDRGRDIATIFSQAGADWISVMAGTSKEVIHGVCDKASGMGKKVIIDILDANSPGQAALEAKGLGANAIMFHQPFDQGESIAFLEDWAMVRGNTDLPIFISAKITRDIIDPIIGLKPNGIVIGRAITHSDDPLAEAQFFYDKTKGKRS